ncbi:hypothetical protein CLU96_3720 [Chryseobacterium sp. 52]|nr:hypothetical protein CLU96_3720 [Chryseobacterium sp. 52]
MTVRRLKKMSYQDAARKPSLYNWKGIMRKANDFHMIVALSDLNKTVSPFQYFLSQDR